MNFSKLQRDKIQARSQLAKLPVEIAQKQADVLFAELWQPNFTTLMEEDFFYTNKIWMVNKLTPVELRNIFLKLQSETLDVVLVGGQAVNFWATYYRNAVPELEAYLPFSSEDIDFYGGRIEASLAHQLLGGKLTINRNFDSSPNSGVLLLDYGKTKLRVDFLTSVFGLSDREIQTSAISFQGRDEIEGIQFKILNPLLCVGSKLKSFVGLPQQSRQDLKHLKISLLFCREFVKEICLKEPPRMGLKLIEQLFNYVLSDAGLQVWLEYEIRIELAIPFNLFEHLTEEKWQSFRSIRLPQVQSEINSKRAKYRKIFG